MASPSAEDIDDARDEADRIAEAMECLGYVLVPWQMDFLVRHILITKQRTPSTGRAGVASRKPGRR